MANIQIYNVAKYVRSYLSPLLRKPRLLAFLYALLRPVQSFRDNLNAVIYPSIERRARYNAQVARFERLLNDQFNTSGIYFDESAVYGRQYTYNALEVQPLYLYNAAESSPFYLYNRLEYLPRFDFTVHVPFAVYSAALQQLKAAVDKYKLAGTTYNIVSY